MVGLSWLQNRPLYNFRLVDWSEIVELIQSLLSLLCCAAVRKPSLDLVPAAGGAVGGAAGGAATGGEAVSAGSRSRSLFAEAAADDEEDEEDLFASTTNNKRK